MAESRVIGAPGERFEWLQTEEAQAQVSAAPGSRAEEAQRCPRCGWVDAVTEVECFRCGERLGGGPLVEGEPAAEVAPPGSVDVVVRGAAEVWQGAVHDAPELCRLRRASAGWSLLPGFEELLSLHHVNRDVFRHYDHQRRVAQRALRDMGGSTLLADETGLGKTIEAGLVAKELLIRGLARVVLVVVPASLAEQWREELAEKFDLEFSVIRGSEDLKGRPERVITSYATLRAKSSVGKWLRERAVDLLICDEAHHLKNRSTKQYKAVSRLQKKYALLLSATPFHNKLVELKNLVDIIKPGLLGSTRAFTRQYVDRKDPRKPQNLAHLRKLLSEVMIRNRRGQVAVRLPPRQAAVYHIQLGEEERAFYDELTEYLRGEVRTRVDQAGLLQQGRPMTLVLALINLQRELCSSPQAVAKALGRMARNERLPIDVQDGLEQWSERAASLPSWRKAAAVDEILERFDEKIVIFCEFRATIDSLAAHLKAQGITVEVFHGGMNGAEKSAALRAFKAEARVLIASRAGAEGLNVQFCSTVLNFDLPWNPMIIEQRIGRVHRLGQERTVKVLNLSVEGTIEARILELLSSKLRLFTAVLGEVDLILGALHNERDFEELLREAWLEGTVSGELETALERFGEALEEARTSYDKIKEGETILDSLTPGEAGRA